jgi:hypothetical protein
MLAAATATVSIQAQNPPGLAGSALPAGMFSTLGNQIVDQNQNPVRLACVYWQGMNGDDGTLSNLNSPLNGYQANANAIAAVGFNCIRVDINNISLHDSGATLFLQGLDKVVAAAGSAGLRIIIVDHDNEGNFGTNDNYSNDCAAQQVNGIWYDLGGASDGTDGCNDPGHTTQASFQSDWVSIANRYANNDTVIGYDLWNEPLSYGDSLWGGGTDNDIHLMYQTVGSAILSADPSKLIFAECPQNYGPTTLFDGVTYGNAPWGDCTGVKALPVVFTVNGNPITNKVVYDVHLYPNVVSGIASLFGGSSSSPSAINAMNYSFGYLVTENIAPVWDGESATGLQVNPDDQDWANMLDEYLNGALGSQGGPVFSGSQQGMGIAWLAWNTTLSGPGNDNIGILNADGSAKSAQLGVIDPLLYFASATPTVRVLGTAVTVAPGVTTGNTSTITVTPGGGFTGSVTLTAALTSSPAGAVNPPTFSFGSTSPVSITNATAGTATLTISTTAATSGALFYPQPHGAPWHATSGATLACFLLFCIPARRRSWQSMLGMMALLVTLAGGMLACGGGGGGGGGGNPGTTAGSYTVTVTGTSGATTATGTFTVNVQ